MADQLKAVDLTSDRAELKQALENRQRQTIERLLAEETNEAEGGKNRSTVVDALKAKLEEYDKADAEEAAKVADDASKSDPNRSAEVGTVKRGPGGKAGEDYGAVLQEPQASAAEGTLPTSKVNAKEVADLAQPVGGPAQVDSNKVRPDARATEIARARADRSKEGPIAGTGAGRVAAPAPAEVPGTPAARMHPGAHDAYREPPALAAPAPTRGAEVESDAPAVAKAEEVAGARKKERDRDETRAREARERARPAPPAPAPGWDATPGSGGGGGGSSTRGPGSTGSS